MDASREPAAKTAVILTWFRLLLASLVLLNTEWYHQKMRPVMAQWMQLWLEANHISGLTAAQIERYISGTMTLAPGDAEQAGDEGSHARQEDDTLQVRSCQLSATSPLRNIMASWHHVIMSSYQLSATSPLLSPASALLSTSAPRNTIVLMSAALHNAGSLL